MARTSKEVEIILQTCLELILYGQETLESVISIYPDVKEVIQPQLEAALWLDGRKQAFSPRPEFITASRHRLENQIRHNLANRNLIRKSTIQVTWDFVKSRNRAFQFAVVFLIVVSLFSFGVSGVALAAKETIPGDVLYPVKIAREQVQLTLSITPQGDVRLYTEFAQERLLEIQMLVLEGRYEQLQNSVSIYETTVNRALYLINFVASRDNAGALALASKLGEVLTTQTMVLELLSKAVPEATKADIEKAINISQMGALATKELHSQIIEEITATATLTPTVTASLVITKLPIISATTTPGNTPTLPRSATPLIAYATATVGIVPTNVFTLATPTVKPKNLPVENPTAIIEVTATAVPEPTYTSAPTSTPVPTYTPVPTELPTSTATIAPSNTPLPTDTSEPSATVEPSATPTPSATAEPSSTPEPPDPSKTPKPTNTHRPTSQPTNPNRTTQEP